MFENRETIAGLPTAAAMVARNADWSIVDLSVGARVMRGLWYVQYAYPDARSTVDVDAIDIYDGACCVLGQIHGSYLDAPELEGFSFEWRVAHGFLTSDGDEWNEELGDYVLNVAWRNAFRSWVGSS